MKSLILIAALAANLAVAQESTFATLPAAGGQVVLGDVRGACSEDQRRAWFVDGDTKAFVMGCWSRVADQVVVVYDDQKDKPRSYPFSSATLAPKYTKGKFSI